MTPMAPRVSAPQPHGMAVLLLADTLWLQVPPFGAGDVIVASALQKTMEATTPSEASLVGCFSPTLSHGRSCPPHHEEQSPRRCVLSEVRVRSALSLRAGCLRCSGLLRSLGLLSLRFAPCPSAGRARFKAASAE